MEQQNPYQAPTSDVENVAENQTYQPSVFSWTGRIGRLRYLAYTWAGYLFFIPAAAVLALLAPDGGDGLSVLAWIMIGISYLAGFTFYFVLSKRRLNDLDHSGWFSILMLVPLLNFFVGLYLIFSAGKAQTNRFGPAPNANSLGVKLLGLALPIFFVLGVLAGIAIPAYQDYVIRAQEATNLVQ